MGLAVAPAGLQPRNSASRGGLWNIEHTAAPASRSSLANRYACTANVS